MQVPFWAIARYATALLMAVAGVAHFVYPKGYLRIMPPFLPWPATLVGLSGVAEIALGVALAIDATQNAAAIGLAGVMVAFFIVHGWHLYAPPAIGLPYWVFVARFALQFGLVWWFWALRGA